MVATVRPLIDHFCICSLWKTIWC